MLSILLSAPALCPIQHTHTEVDSYNRPPALARFSAKAWTGPFRNHAGKHSCAIEKASGFWQVHLPWLHDASRKSMCTQTIAYCPIKLQTGTATYRNNCPVMQTYVFFLNLSICATTEASCSPSFVNFNIAAMKQFKVTGAL